MRQKLRSLDEIVRRALAVWATFELSYSEADREHHDENRRKVLLWVEENNLGIELSPTERQFVFDPKPSEKAQIHFSWMAERLYVLFWALSLVEEMSAPNEQCCFALSDSFYSRDDAWLLLSERVWSSAKRRPDSELLEMQDTLMNLHAQARTAKLRGIQCAEANLGVVQERHAAINWIVGYEGLSWDDIRCDT
jgi:hypothetical protein